jgi:hypothetical protein
MLGSCGRWVGKEGWEEGVAGKPERRKIGKERGVGVGRMDMRRGWEERFISGVERRRLE